MYVLHYFIYFYIFLLWFDFSDITSYMCPRKGHENQTQTESGVWSSNHLICDGFGSLNTNPWSWFISSCQPGRKQGKECEFGSGWFWTATVQFIEVLWVVDEGTTLAEFNCQCHWMAGRGTDCHHLGSNCRGTRRTMGAQRWDVECTLVVDASSLYCRVCHGQSRLMVSLSYA